MLLIFLYFTILLVTYVESLTVTRKDSSNPEDVTSSLIKSLSCGVEISDKMLLFKSRDCIVSKYGCKKRKIPLKEDIPPSKEPPASKNKQYQMLATTAEKLVPETWWRKGFADELLLLTHKEDIPYKLLDTKISWNKKLKNMGQCTSRQTFIRKTFTANSSAGISCPHVESNITERMWVLWNSKPSFQEELLRESGQNCEGSLACNICSRRPYSWEISSDMKQHEIRNVAHLFVLDSYRQFGGIWTGCMSLTQFIGCRVTLAAALFILATYSLYDILANIEKLQWKTFEDDLINAYLFANIGRSLLHGNKKGTDDSPVSVWGLRLSHFTQLQNAFLDLYVATVGRVYTEQLRAAVPLTFIPNFPVYTKKLWDRKALHLEPIHASLRNWMFTETNSLIDFSPYKPLVSFPDVRSILQSRISGRRVLIDVGANGFFASPKYLLDSYAPFLPFTHAVMIEPEPHFSANIPAPYRAKYVIEFLQIYAEVGTNSSQDIIKLLPTLVSKQDFVVLKFDVDPNRYAQGPTMEWGFLFSLMANIETALLVDELYIELHFHQPELQWYHYHSNWEALDCLRYLRDHGMIVHAWP